MIIRAPRVETNFYHLDKRISEDTRLSWAARGLLIFLLGKLDHWKISIAHLQKQANESAKPTGRDGIYNLLNELITIGYVQRIQNNNTDGKFKKTDYLVTEIPLTGFQEAVKIPHTDFQEAVVKNTNPDISGLADDLNEISPLPDLPYPAEPYPVNPTLVKKDLSKDVFKEGRSLSNDVAIAQKQKSAQKFEEFYAAYPRKKDREKALKAWKKIEPDLYEIIITDVMNKAANDVQWKDSQYILYPATYLNGKRWNDVLELEQPKRMSFAEQKDQERKARDAAIFRNAADDDENENDTTNPFSLASINDKSRTLDGECHVIN